MSKHKTLDDVTVEYLGQQALSAKGNPRLDHVNLIMRAMGYQLRPQRLESVAT